MRAHGCMWTLCFENAALVESRLRHYLHMGGVLFGYGHVFVRSFSCRRRVYSLFSCIKFLLQKNIICHFLLVFYVFLCFQNLWVKNYSDGDWISEDDLAKGINTRS